MLMWLVEWKYGTRSGEMLTGAATMDQAIRNVANFEEIPEFGSVVWKVSPRD